MRVDIEHEKTVIAVVQGNALDGFQGVVQAVRRGGRGIDPYTDQRARPSLPQKIAVICVAVRDVKPFGDIVFRAGKKGFFQRGGKRNDGQAMGILVRNVHRRYLLGGNLRAGERSAILVALASDKIKHTGRRDTMQYKNVQKAVFCERPNRFIARVNVGGADELVHVKNTGRCRELLLPGATVYLEESGNPARKTRYDLIAVEKGARLINMDAQAPNQVFKEWAEAGRFRPDLTVLRPETKWGSSRFDFYWEAGERAARSIFQTPPQSGG